MNKWKNKTYYLKNAVENPVRDSIWGSTIDSSTKNPVVDFILTFIWTSTVSPAERSIRLSMLETIVDE